MQAVIMHPGGVAAGLASAEATQQLEVTPEQIESVITRSQALSSIERLEIYSRAYYARLLECLRSQFPILAKSLGNEVFDPFALGYLRRYPSQSYTLALLGSQFVQYLEETRPAEAVGEAWSEALIDLARLEFEFDQVFDGPGVEDSALVSAADLLAIPGDRWPEAKLVLAPCLRLLELRHPMHEYYRSLRRDEDVAFPSPRPTYLAITRRDFVVRFFPLTRSQFVLLQTLQRGDAIGQALQDAAEEHGDLDQLAADLHAWFQSWTAEGFFLRIELP